MSRLIKFRAWDTIENCWKIFDIKSMFEATRLFNYKYVNFSEWQQFTGLKDKNGKEIYEGDIIAIRGEDDEKDYYYEVEFRCGCWMACNELYNDINYNGFTKLEVIGNIFQNPELLNN